MKLPAGYSEAQVLEAIEKAANMLAPSFVFGYWSIEDIKQEARIYGLECLDRFDTTRPLVNFVFAHVRNRLINLCRNKLRRSDAPCMKCHDGDPCTGGKYCEKYQVWLKRNSAKINVLCPLDINYISDDNESGTKCESTVCEESEVSELCELIDEKLPVGLRAAFLQLRAGVSLPKAKRLEVEQAVKEILGCQADQEE